MGRKRKYHKDLPERVYFNHGKYYFVDKNQKWHNLGADYYQAMIRYAEINHVKKSIYTLNHVADQYVKTELPKKAIKTQREYLKNLIPIRKVFGEMGPDDIRPSHIYKYMSMRPPIIANREKTMLSQLMKLAIQLDLTTTNPCKYVQRNPEKARNREIQDNEFIEVYKRAPDALKNAMDLALVTGLREADILKLTLSENWSKKGLKVLTGKTGKEILFKATPALVQIVERCAKSDTSIQSMHLIRTTKGQGYSSSGFQKVFGRLMTKVVAATGIERFQFRDIRARAGKESDDEKFLGHQDPSTYHRHYRPGTLNVTPIEPEILGNLEDIRQSDLKNNRK